MYEHLSKELIGYRALATKALAALCGLDILVNNAGGGRAFWEGSLGQYRGVPGSGR
jgi:hypothetical protein